MTKSNAVTFEQYKAAAGRIRRGTARLGDAALCDRYDAQQLAKPAIIYQRITDLPMAEGMFRADCKDSTKW